MIRCTIILLNVILLTRSVCYAHQRIASFDDLPRLDADSFSKVVQATDLFVMFYAPWCGHCKKLKPTWVELAQKYNAGPLTIATVDCTTDTELCSDENIRGYPTLMLYVPYGGNDRQNGIRFAGARTLSALNTFIEQHTDTEASDNTELSVETEEGVYIVTKDNYLEVFKHSSAFVMFYAPWCKHCKTLKPTWETLAAMYNDEEQETQTIIAKVDCTKNNMVCSEYEVEAYPTLLYLQAGKIVAKYDGPRQLDDLLSFVDKQYSSSSDDDEDDEDIGKIPTHNTDDESEGSVVVVEGSTFQEVTGSAYILTFMEFYAPWCGHCKRLAPIWELLAKHYTEDSSVTIAKIDCTEHAHICRAQDISGYPTLKLYKNSRMIAEFDDERTFGELVKFVDKYKSKDEL